MEIRSIPALPPAPQGLATSAATAAPARTAPQGLDPPVKLDIGAGADDTRFVRDLGTKALVFQLVDPASGDVIVQLPTETVLRNRAYEASRAQVQPGAVSRIA